MKRANTFLKGLLVLVLAIGFVGCGALEDLNPFDNEKEVSGLVEALDANSLTVEGIAYAVNADTKFDGIDGLSDLNVGDEVEVEYEENGGGRTALEVELSDGDSDN